MSQEQIHRSRARANPAPASNVFRSSPLGAPSPARVRRSPPARHEFVGNETASAGLYDDVKRGRKCSSEVMAIRAQGLIPPLVDQSVRQSKAAPHRMNREGSTTETAVAHGLAARDGRCPPRQRHKFTTAGLENSRQAASRARRPSSGHYRVLQQLPDRVPATTPVPSSARFCLQPPSRASDRNRCRPDGRLIAIQS